MPAFPKFLIFSAFPFPFPFPKKNYATTLNIEAPCYFTSGMADSPNKPPVFSESAETIIDLV